MNPLQIHGPAYIGIYLVICIGAFVVALAVKAAIANASCASSGQSDSALAGQLDAYDIAYLSGGPDRVLLSALGALLKHEYVVIDSNRSGLAVGSKEPNEKMHDLEEMLYSKIKSGYTTASECKSDSRTQTVVKRVETKLERLGLLCSQIDWNNGAMVAWFLFLAVAGYCSLPRIVSAAAAGRPVSVLIFETFLAFFASFILMRTPSRVSRRGKQLLYQIQAENAALKVSHGNNSAGGLSLSESALAYALFGAVFLSLDPFRQAQAALYGQSSSSGSSCGGSSCGSSCGGGCGGGGCGG